MECATTARNEQFCTKCQTPGKLACSGCRLVVYCSRACQTADWSHHKVSCKSPLSKSSWSPHWDQERRPPSFVQCGPALMDLHGGGKYFWGNVPALDIIRLGANEGLEYKKHLLVLLAASGDLRNAVKSVGALPDQYTNRLRLFINDRDFEVVARNIIITLIGMTVQDCAQAVTCMLHVWYSALIRESDANILTTKILPLFEDVNRKIEGKASGLLLGKTWTLGKNTVRVELTKANWLKLLLFTQQPAHRVCASRFFEEGLLLPFGASREEFIVPNATFFQSNEWPMSDGANPLQGWGAADVLSTDSGPATGDLYGKLFYHISSHLTNFYDRLVRHGTDFSFSNVDATSLNDQESLKKKAFDRIEVSNISDDLYLGIAQTVRYLGVRLQNVTKNPHASMITLFMNAVTEVVHSEEGSSIDQMKSDEALAQVKKFVKLSKSTDFHGNSPGILRMTAAACHFRDLDADFDKYMVSREFRGLEIVSTMLVPGGVHMKKNHTIVEKWPLRLKLKHGQPGAQSEFEILEASGHTGHDRYVEWKRGG